MDPFDKLVELVPFASSYDNDRSVVVISDPPLQIQINGLFSGALPKPDSLHLSSNPYAYLYVHLSNFEYQSFQVAGFRQNQVHGMIRALRKHV